MANARNTYQLAGVGMTFVNKVFGIGGDYLTQRDDGLRFGGSVGLSFSTDDQDFLGIRSSEFVIGFGGLFGYDFDPVWIDIGSNFGYGWITAQENSSWLFQNRPIVRNGDGLANGLQFAVVPRFGTHINTESVIIVPRFSIGFSWLWYSLTENANRSLSADLSQYVDIIDDTSVNAFGFSIGPGVSFIFEQFCISLGVNIPIRIKSEAEIVFIDGSKFSETANSDRNIGLNVGVGFRF